MKGYIEERAIELAGFIIENNATVRAAAKKFGISKSTVHKDVTERLAKINTVLAEETKKVLEKIKLKDISEAGWQLKLNISKEAKLCLKRSEKMININMGKRQYKYVY